MHFLLGRLQLFLLLRYSVVFVHVADVNIVHLREKFACWVIAGTSPRTHVAQATGRIRTEGVEAIRGPGFVSHCVELGLGQLLGVVPCTGIPEETVATQIKVVAQPRILVVKKLEVFLIVGQWCIKTLAILILVYDRRGNRHCRRM